MIPRCHFISLRPHGTGALQGRRNGPGTPFAVTGETCRALTFARTRHSGSVLTSPFTSRSHRRGLSEDPGKEVAFSFIVLYCSLS